MGDVLRTIFIGDVLVTSLCLAAFLLGWVYKLLSMAVTRGRIQVSDYNVFETTILGFAIMACMAFFYCVGYAAQRL